MPNSNLILQTYEQAVRQRRSQMLVHSYIYYKLGTQIVTDSQFDRWANELVSLQAGEHVTIGFYDEEFKDWDASTGFHLPQDDWVAHKAQQLIRYKEKNATV